jgi:hypothetical protein
VSGAAKQIREGKKFSIFHDAKLYLYNTINNEKLYIIMKNEQNA